MIIIAAVVLLLAAGVLKRQAVEETSGLVNEAMPTMPKNEFTALATKPQSPLTGGQFMTQPQQTELLPGPPSTFSTEPVQTEQTPYCSAPQRLQVPSTPVPEQLVIPSTPTGRGEENSEEEMTDPLLEALMHQAQAGLYIVPRRVDEIHS